MSANYRRQGASPTNHCWCQKTDLPFRAVPKYLQCIAWFGFVTKYACDRQTDGGQTDNTKAELHIAALRGNEIITREDTFDVFDCAIQLCRWMFSDNETLEQTFNCFWSKFLRKRQIWVSEPHFGEARGTHDLGRWLIGKTVVDFLFALIELFRCLLRFRSYEGNVYSSAVFAVGRSRALKFYLDRVVPHQPFLAPENWRHLATRR